MGVIIRGVVPADRGAIGEALRACGAFTAEEVEVALGMVDAGLAGDYTLLAIDIAGTARGYACIGKAPLTHDSWYVYWLCVHPLVQHSGLGRLLQDGIEQFVRDAGGTRVVLETSGRAAYNRARRFYESAGYGVAGIIPDFYAAGDDCVVYWKPVGAPDERSRVKLVGDAPA